MTLRPSARVILGVILVGLLVPIILMAVARTFVLGPGRGFFRLRTFLRFGLGFPFFFVRSRGLFLVRLGPFGRLMPLTRTFLAVIPGSEQFPQTLQGIGPGSRLLLLFLLRATRRWGLPRNLGLAGGLGSL